ncbi:hypothetical protein P7D22_16490, partial [Lichenihabitans sp. Uapishka_5]|uniref:alpha/beta hydrolase n=1 Tax=Lichenihabitans sp. Uapishka_5 TaxID=3037302 RepID=UPI0029EBA395|nr:hypothetical protein [Lichenihabitans sp. Uapishka_5]
AQSTDDPIAPVDNSRLMASALRQAGVPAELHVFDTGGHGWGMGQPGTEPAVWPDLLQAWLERGAGASHHPAPT